MGSLDRSRRPADPQALALEAHHHRNQAFKRSEVAVELPAKIQRIA